MSLLRLAERCGCRDTGGFPGTHPLPGDRPAWPADRPAEIRHVRLDLTLEPGDGLLFGTATYDLSPFSDGLDSITFDAVEMEISGAVLDRRPAVFDYDGSHLRVRLEPPGLRGQERRLSVTYAARPRAGMYFIRPDQSYPDKPSQAWTQGQDDDSRHWFPCFDQPNGRQTTEARITVPGDWLVLSNGRLLEDKKLRNGLRRFHWHQDRPHSTYLVSVVAGPFERVELASQGPLVDCYVEPQHLPAVERTFGATPAMIAFFEQVIGLPYPWSKYSQAVVRDFVLGGMENTTATTLTDAIVVDERAGLDYRAEPLVSHELAHQWFGNLLTCREWSHGWLNEGFATYLELLWDEHRWGRDWYQSGVMENTREYLEESYRRPLVSNVYRAPIDIFDRHLYEKGALVLHMLRHVLGDEAFFRSLRRYAREHADRGVLTQDFVDAIEAETGRNLGWFFDQWVFKPGHPALKVAWAWDEATRVATVTVDQTQEARDGVPEAFRFPVTIDFRSLRGRRRAVRVEVGERHHVFAFPLPARPDVCRFDPDNEVLKEIVFEKAPLELLLQLRSDDGVSGRCYAAHELARSGAAEAVGALETALRHDRAWRVQAEAARALGEVRTNAARDALLRGLGVREPRARRAVAEALGEFRLDESVLEALLPVARRDASWFVRAEALRAAGRLRIPRAFDPLVEALSVRSFREVVRAGALDGLVELRDERAVDVIEGAAHYGEPAAARRFAVSALGRLGTVLPGRSKDLADRVVPFLRDPDFRVRMAAAGALKALGVDSHVQELESMARREVDGRTVRAAREAALALRNPAPVAAATAPLRDDLERVREENSRLAERLAVLEARLGAPTAADGSATSR